ncbi:hypothetical protein BJ138DRAFT_1018596 [Hygrophoropsis aurantiaca]|uniref:Uncharacterized protein n=1 Tax=Hygrophoropsis aurantiaca TaxID=72124 RepID=A0ACB7ZUS4_9AGAM|nr:hypothetical protein BJ138DRAFT_1018596 [Hygrophoropsis aurantiaca]
MPSAPPDVNVDSVLAAKGAQLRHWIDEANKNAGKKELTKSGKIDDLRIKLATYYGLNLFGHPSSAAVLPVAGPPTHDQNIQERQWEWARELGKEWEDTVAARRPFSLQETSSAESSGECIPGCSHCYRKMISLSLSLSTRSGTNSSASRPTTSLLLADTSNDPGSFEPQSAQHSDLLYGDGAFQPAGYSPLSARSILPTEYSPTSTCLPSPADQSKSLPCSAPTSIAMPPASTGPELSLCHDLPLPLLSPVPNEASILRLCTADITALDRAETLRDMIIQVENGSVQRIRDRYGPVPGRASDPMWKTLKGKVTKRERLHQQLIEQFDSNKERFFAFFTVDIGSAKRSKKKHSPCLRPSRLVVEAIPHLTRDLKEERKKDMYQDGEGRFAAHLWEARWGDANDWEVWRIMGKEFYGRKN